MSAKAAFLAPEPAVENGLGELMASVSLAEPPGARAKEEVSPEVSVVVVAYESRPEIDRCLSSLEPGADGIPFEAWVVDNGSHDGTAEHVASAWPDVRVLENARNLGFAAAANLAIERSEGRFVLLLNPDARLESGAIRRLVEYARERPRVGIAGPRVYDDESRTAIQPSFRSFPTLAQAVFHHASFASRLFPGNPWTRRYLQRDRDGALPGPVDWVAFSCALVRREVFQRAGLLDAGFFLYCEDVDLCRRAAKAGFEIHFVPQADAVHEGGRSAGRAPVRAVLARHRSLWRYALKHIPAARAIAPLVLAGLIVRAVFLIGGVGLRSLRRRS